MQEEREFIERNGIDHFIIGLQGFYFSTSGEKDACLWDVETTRVKMWLILLYINYFVKTYLIVIVGSDI